MKSGYRLLNNLHEEGSFSILIRWRDVEGYLEALSPHEDPYVHVEGSLRLVLVKSQPSETWHLGESHVPSLRSRYGKRVSRDLGLSGDQTAVEGYGLVVQHKKNSYNGDMNGFLGQMKNLLSVDNFEVFVTHMWSS